MKSITMNFPHVIFPHEAGGKSNYLIFKEIIFPHFPPLKGGIYTGV